MRKMINRKIIVATVYAYITTIIDGIPRVEALDSYEMYGKVTKLEALRELKSKYGKQASITIERIEFEECQYEISPKEFVAHATKINSTKI